MIPLATEAWPAVFGGLIPIIGLAGIAYIIYRAVRDPDDDEKQADEQQANEKQAGEQQANDEDRSREG